MPALLALIPAAISAGQAVAGALGGGKQSTTTQNQNQGGAFSQSSTTTPNLSPFQSQLAQLFTRGAQGLWDQSTNLSPYTTQGMQGITQQGSANRENIANSLAARGLSYSPAAATALTQNTLNTGNQQSQFLSQIPLLQRQLQQQSLQQLIGAFGALPTSVTSATSGTSTGTGGGSQSVFGNPAAGAVGGGTAGLASSWPLLYQAFGQPNPYSPKVPAWQPSSQGPSSMNPYDTNFGG